MLPANVLSYGSDEPLPAQVPLRAGPLALIYEAGDLRYVRLGGREVLRRIYAAVRDRNWGTVPGARTSERVEAGPDSFRISYDVTHRQGDIDFRWSALITGAPDGTIRCEMDGQAHSSFLRNRIGFCVLHPAECAGAAATVERVDGASHQTRLPALITPDQPPEPFTDMSALAHEVEPGVWARVAFEGDAFELEDQRNWTDASFKTFSTPLRLPFPVEVPEGARVKQTVTLTINARRETRNAQARTSIDSTGSDSNALFCVQPSSFSLPPLGLGLASHGRPLTQREVARLRGLRLAHLRADLDLARAGAEAALARAMSEAAALDVPLELALLLPDEPDAALRDLRALLDRARPRVVSWLIFAANERLRGGTPTRAIVAATRRHLAEHLEGARVAAGSNNDYIFVGRNPPPADLTDHLCIPTNPQTHAFDLASVTEAVAAQQTLAWSARETYGQPVIVSPVTLLPRHNPYATGALPEPPAGALPPQVDPRQMSLYGAGWTAASITYLAQGGAASLTYYETTGWRGVMESEAGSPLPERFRSIPGAVFPLYHVLADVGDLAGGDVLAGVSSDPLRFEGLALRLGGRTRVVLASFDANPQEVRLEGLGTQGRARVLDAASADEAMRDPESFRARPGDPLESDGEGLRVPLPPFAVVTIDSH
ncbi:MAG: hypothetical protein RLZZ387_1596 [Chloroflexota bacterium]|jgi:hypothetical protein